MYLYKKTEVTNWKRKNIYSASVNHLDFQPKGVCWFQILKFADLHLSLYTYLNIFFQF